jgi:hypothetical protein
MSSKWFRTLSFNMALYEVGPCQYPFLAGVPTLWLQERATLPRSRSAHGADETLDPCVTPRCSSLACPDRSSSYILLQEPLQQSPKKMKPRLTNRICRTWYRLAIGEQRCSMCSIRQTIQEVEARLDTFGIPVSKLMLLTEAEALPSLPGQVKLNNLFRFLEVPSRRSTRYPAQPYTPRAC